MIVACDQSQPSSPSDDINRITSATGAKKGGSATTYEGAHTALYTPSSSDISGTVTGMTYTTSFSQLAGSGSMTFSGSIAEKIRNNTPETNGTGSITLSGSVNIWANSGKAQWVFVWKATGTNDQYKLSIGGPGSDIGTSDETGAVSGTYPSSSTITFDGDPFNISHIAKGKTVADWAYTNNTPVSFTVATSTE